MLNEVGEQEGPGIQHLFSRIVQPGADMTSISSTTGKTLLQDLSGLHGLM
jgi:hypothetical protein